MPNSSDSTPTGIRVDFTIRTYNRLIQLLRTKEPRTVLQSLTRPGEKGVILRHDVDAVPENSLRFAETQNDLEIRSTYYFRMVPGSYQPRLMERIAGLGHEIGYHYEDVEAALKTLRKEGGRFDEERLIDTAFEMFCGHLDEFKKRFDVRTICAHGSPLCRYDNKLLWKKFDYRSLGIIGDAGLDVDFSDCLYFTDTGRRWDGDSVSLRDKTSRTMPVHFRTTFDVIDAISEGRFPDRSMMTFHPQRWNDDPLRWTGELVRQNIKNVVKYLMIRSMSRKNQSVAE